MSYTILYNDIFLKSSNGITAVILAGSNNVWETNQKRARSWGVFCNLLDAKPEDLISKVAKSIESNPDSEYWMKNNRWVDGNGALRWMKNGIKTASSIEDIISVNNFSSIKVSLSYHLGDGWKEDMVEYIKTTEEFDAWIKKAKAFQAKITTEKHSVVYFDIHFDTETVKKTKDKLKNKDVLIKHNGMYLTSYKDSASNWSGNIKNAKVLSYDEALEFKKVFCWPGSDRTLTFMDAAIKAHPWNAVITNTVLSYQNYVSKITARRVSITGSIKEARFYPDEAAAQKAVANIERKNPKRKGVYKVLTV